ncbi:hypothetical protein TSOC_009905 [Tetrabaena socialis]|uniref:Uncharacterized protein n=1 Tax=Tetrabaena socialis TaxID=47790 RepID=A0A2J7ZUM7_9CHLO|nr:hypothetical protein TSOC_009905 [Tetrabaena socialis]|eukprot:PNH03976.1 hypothetical protein TSOC_009905 [Tetrabaena socialis]
MDANSAGSNGGAFATNRGISLLSVADFSSISGNTAAGNGGAVYAYQAIDHVNVTNGSRLSVNQALGGYGGAVYIDAGAYDNDDGFNTSSVSILSGSQMNGNVAMKSGGAFFTGRGLAVLLVAKNSSIDSNSVNTTNGGAMSIHQSIGRIVVADSSSMSFNRAGGHGGVLHVEGNKFKNYHLVRSLAVERFSHVDNNTAGQSGGAFSFGWGLGSPIVDGNSSSNNDSASAVSVLLDSMVITDESSISFNTAQGHGGAVYVDQGLGSVTLFNSSRMSYNQALAGAGGAVFVSLSLGSFTVANSSSVSRNSAQIDGGAICVAVDDGVNDYETSPCTLAVIGGSSIDGNTAECPLCSLPKVGLNISVELLPLGVGLLAFIGTVAFTLYTCFSNLGQQHADAMEAHAVSSLDVLKSLSLAHQLAVVLIIASFILYPSLCQTTLGIYACYIIDSGAGAFKENQKASWPHGYWVRDMQQRCYDGIHHQIYMPIGVASTVAFCLGLPLIYFLLVWRCRHNLKDVSVQIKYGFLYVQYKPRFFWWAAVLQVQTLALVTVQTFGRTVVVLKQAMLLLIVLITNAAITMACSPLRFPLIMMLEFLSSAVLSLTVTLSLTFLEGSSSSLPSSTAVSGHMPV